METLQLNLTQKINRVPFGIARGITVSAQARDMVRRERNRSAQREIDSIMETILAECF